MWISWNKVHPGLKRGISLKPWSLAGRFSICQSWCCGFVTDLRPLVCGDDLFSQTGLSVGLCHQIVTKYLDMIRTSSKFVLRILKEKQKKVRMEVCQSMIEMSRIDPEWIQKSLLGMRNGYISMTRTPNVNPKPKKTELLQLDAWLSELLEAKVAAHWRIPNSLKPASKVSPSKLLALTWSNPVSRMDNCMLSALELAQEEILCFGSRK
ncbi:KIAA0430 [Cordylochernes scorpioides]|uniref:KIAA0430 n=1 Tax=Cordylochernes scorpioides TaxID=51811 RepID=A0ABY6KH78_9ARAC|nr:KIAA0430 [Cordylochernes scorpioides]